MNRKHIYKAVIASAHGLSLGAVWQHIEVECRPFSTSIGLRKEIFFDLLYQLLNAGKARLACGGTYLTGTVEEQLRLFARYWPQPGSEDELDDLDTTGLWFLAKAPAGLVWITADGQEIWT